MLTPCFLVNRLQGVCIPRDRLDSLRFEAELIEDRLALISSLEERRSSANENNDDYYLFSYGSGCGAALLQGRLSPTWKQQTDLLKSCATLLERTRLSVEEYEKLVDIYENSDNLSQDDLAVSDVGGAFRYLGTEKDKRRYGPSQKDARK